ncbi:hypothetical protein PRIPAC_95716, partial [Pristionchus pacificus]|uniref:Uncharacterized protein n=1 Tax=Pristionchus pacificus TaxID=54126 RepID=A0A2A6D396_PRIPA
CQASLVVFMRTRLQFMRKGRSALLYHPASSQARIIKTQRCDRIISLYVPYQVLSMLLTTSLGTFIVLQVQRNYPDHFLLFQSLIYLSITPKTILALLLPLFFHPALYKSLRQYFGRERSTDKRDVSRRVELTTCDDQPKYIIVRTNEQCTSPGQDIELCLANDSASCGTE